MSDTATRQQLLAVCIQDLHAGATQFADKLPRVARHATDPALAQLLADQVEAARQQATQLESTGRKVDGPTNLWMAGILKDSKRDTKSIKPGALLDIAMVGAVRKAHAASIVSYETAIALARRLDAGAIGSILEAIHAEETAADKALADRLDALMGTRT